MPGIFPYYLMSHFVRMPLRVRLTCPLSPGVPINGDVCCFDIHKRKIGLE